MKLVLWVAASAVLGAAPCLIGCGDVDTLGKTRDNVERDGGSGGGTGHEPMCLVEGQMYEHGDSVPSPFNCNICVCSFGELVDCTLLPCPFEKCRVNTVQGKRCIQCGTAGGCAVIETGCLPFCATDDDCSSATRGGGLNRSCTDGVCSVTMCL